MVHYIQETIKQIAKKVINNMRELIAQYIEDEEDRISFLNGEIGPYIITGLDLSLIKNYNFDDGNDYKFENCTICDVNIKFCNEDLLFQNCVFSGDVVISNNYVLNEEDEQIFGNIDLDGCKDGMNLKSLSITSPILGLIGCKINAKEKAEFIGDKLVLEPFFDEDTHEVDRTYISSDEEIIIDSIHPTIDAVFMSSKSINIKGYNLFRMRNCILDGTTNFPVKDGMFRYERIIKESIINGELVNISDIEESISPKEI